MYVCIRCGHQFGPTKKFLRGEILHGVSDVMSMLVSSMLMLYIVNHSITKRGKQLWDKFWFNSTQLQKEIWSVYNPLLFKYQCEY